MTIDSWSFYKLQLEADSHRSPLTTTEYTTGRYKFSVVLRHGIWGLTTKVTRNKGRHEAWRGQYRGRLHPHTTFLNCGNPA